MSECAAATSAAIPTVRFGACTPLRSKATRIVSRICRVVNATQARYRPTASMVCPAAAQTAMDAFQRVVETGDLQSLLDILAPDVVLLGDGGGVKPAVPRPIVGAAKVARLLVAGLGRVRAEMSVEPAQVNGCPALILRLNGELDTVVAVRIDDGLVTGLGWRVDRSFCCVCPLSRASPRSEAGPCHPGRRGAPTVEARSMTAALGRMGCRRPPRWA